MTVPAVSIVVPAYNRSGSIRMAVESILRQTFTDFELLVVDDGSTDGTMEALAQVTDPRLKRLANPRNMGASAARNTGIRAARAEWVAFQDSDDEWLPLKLEKQMARLATAPADTVACYCGMAILGGPEEMAGRMSVRYIPDPRLRLVEGDIRLTVLSHSPASTQTLIARRKALEKVGGFDEALPALVDWDCVMRLAQLGSFAFVDEPLVLQNFSENSITRSLQKRTTARRRIVEKNADLYAGHPALQAKQWISVAGDERRLGEVERARAALAEAAKLTPFSPALWLRRIRLVLGRNRLLP